MCGVIEMGGVIEVGGATEEGGATVDAGFIDWESASSCSNWPMGAMDRLTMKLMLVSSSLCFTGVNKGDTHTVAGFLLVGVECINIIIWSQF